MVDMVIYGLLYIILMVLIMASYMAHSPLTLVRHNKYWIINNVYIYIYIHCILIYIYIVIMRN